MSVQGEIKGNQLILTIDLSQDPRQSKSALRKAQEAHVKSGAKTPFDPATVPATLVADTGGFARYGKYRVNAMVLV